MGKRSFSRFAAYVAELPYLTRSSLLDATGGEVEEVPYTFSNVRVISTMVAPRTPICFRSIWVCLQSARNARMSFLIVSGNGTLSFPESS